MAAKSKAKPQANRASVAKSKGPHFTAVQWKAYDKAAKKARQQAQFRDEVAALQRRRLQGAAKATRKQALARQQAVQLRIRRNAVRQTWRQTAMGHQSKNLRLQAAHRLFRTQSIATQKQFAYRGISIWAHTTRMQTLTRSQAESQERAYAAAARKRAMANLSWAKARRPVKTVAKGRPKGSAGGKRGKYYTVGRQSGLLAANATRPGPKKTSKKPKARKAAIVRHETLADAQWITAGNDEGKENCVAVAIANHLLYHTGYRVPDDLVECLVGSFRVKRVDRMLDFLDFLRVWGPEADLSEYARIEPCHAEPGMIVGFDVTVDGRAKPHCGVLLSGNKVISWGEVVSLESEIDEAWSVHWTATTA